MLVLNIPIEPLESRYSIQWQNWFQKEFTEQKINFINILGKDTSGKINKGSFLDIYETNKYKTEQLTEIIKFIGTKGNYSKDETIILFFHDIWFPGIVNIAYMRDALKIQNLRMVGCLHAGAYDPYDMLNLTGMDSWASHFENGIFDILDQIYVATVFHKNLITEKRIINPNKIKITGFPLFDDFSKCNPERKDLVVFPHRLNFEKCPGKFDWMKDKAKTNFKFIKTKEEAVLKSEYYNILNISKIAISTALQETWGIAMQEAVICGCIPIVPNSLSYAEMYLSEFKYNTLEEAVQLINKFSLPGIFEQYTELVNIQKDKLITSGKNAIPNIITEFKYLNYENKYNSKSGFYSNT